MRMDCDGEVAGTQADCTYPLPPKPGANFQASIQATTPPDQGYLGFDAATSWTNVNLNYVTHQVKGVWPDCAFPASAGPQPVPGDASRERVTVGCAAGVSAQKSTYTGPIVTLDLKCVAEGTTTIDLDEGSGNTDYVVDSSKTVPASTAGATVHCGVVDGPPPKLKLLNAIGGRRVQRVLKQRGVNVTATCNKRCDVALSGTVSVPGASKRVKLKRAKGVLGANAKGKFKLAASKKTLKALRRAFTKRKRLVAKISSTATDLDGNKDAASLKIKLKP